MIDAKIDGVEFIAANTDAQALRQFKGKTILQIGSSVTKGLGAGANPEVGRQAALEDRDHIMEMLAGADMVFITAGMGGGTGTGAAPIVAEVAREMGILTVAVVTKPFSFEGKKRTRQAIQGIEALKEVADTVITIPNDRLRGLASKNAKMIEMFRKADEILLHSVKGITDLIMMPGLVNLDFADVRTVMSEGGAALMAVGVASGENRAKIAAEESVSSQLLEVTIDGSRGILFNITGGTGMTLFEVNQAAAIIRERAHPDANMIFGAVIDEGMGDSIRITVIATGFETSPSRRQLMSSVVRSEQPARMTTQVDKPMAAQPKRESKPPETERVSVQQGSSNGNPKPEKVEAPSSSNSAADAPPRFSPNNLDIPAFLRRR